jgi:pilus assembly protein Flp/PilA
MSSLQSSLAARAWQASENAARAKGDGVVSILLKRFQDDTSGATAIEYALIAGLISIVIIGAATSIGSSLFNIFTNVNNGFSAS